MLARIYTDAGLQARASATYRRVLMLDPHNAEALAAEKPELPQPPETPSALKRLLRKR